ncbi:S-adenosyl-L-methionine-dependent methyltransferase [Mycena belliarum]|uniref:S-adenosyl-L-methionine-dependent methyltransferase n=1 Tax=Mycena belliarum TaxID=1033014 RepID=A0AAD6TUI5_9AGAR|nr:S-adenosyl-L-methionine-dependent methyltransferase [Mycena belliae]
MSADIDDDDDCYQAIEAAQVFYNMHGRRFTALNTAYLLPVEEDEFERSSLIHRLIQFMFNGRVYIGPVKETLQLGPYRKVLDLGSGRGFWAVEMCDLFPWVCSNNCTSRPTLPRFEVWDINMPDMPYAEDTFDLIHARCVHTGIPNYPRFLSEIGRLVRPGGLVILIEPDLRPMTSPKSSTRSGLTYRSCLVSLGIDVTVPQRLGALLEQTGRFEKITEYTGTIPIGFYPEDPRILTVGQLQWMAYDLLLPGLKPMFLHLGLREARVDRIIKDAQQDLYHTEYRLASHLRVVYALRRPH